MGFFTPSCARFRDHPCRVVIALFLLTACSAEQEDFGISIQSISTRHADRSLRVVVHQKLTLSPEAKRALDHGVPLVFKTQVTVRDTIARTELEQASEEIELSYLPLSDRYQLFLASTQHARTFPRLRHALAEVDTLEFTLPFSVKDAANLELRVRSRLDKSSMPPPMRLPAWFSSQWRHDSGWTRWPLQS